MMPIGSIPLLKLAVIAFLDDLEGSMRKITVALLLIVFGCGIAGSGWSAYQGRDNVAKASSLVASHLLAFDAEPALDLSSFLARGEDAEKALTADLLEMQSADWSGAETKKDAAIEFTSRAISVIRTYTRFRMSNLQVGLTKRRLLAEEGALAQETDPSLRDLASHRLQSYKDKYVEELRDFNHLTTAIGMHCEMLLIANDGIKVVFGESMGLDVPTQEFMKQLL
ncbi:MAG: hypothetical protein CFE48_02370 [Pseudomonas sp. PGPPP2]|jgi:hypothetical protein|nr:MAG: hypothetical protein CFE48_02370 [Pseudomonas sp. PGPPP2]